MFFFNSHHLLVPFYEHNFFSLLLTLSSCPVSWVCWWTHTTPPWRTGWEVAPPVASSLPLTCWTQCPPCTPTKTHRTSQSAISLAMNSKSSSADLLNTMPSLPTPKKQHTQDRSVRDKTGSGKFSSADMLNTMPSLHTPKKHQHTHHQSGRDKSSSPPEHVERKTQDNNSYASCMKIRTDRILQ